MKTVIALLLSLGCITAANADTSSPLCDLEVQGAEALFDDCRTACDEWKAASLITLTVAVTTCAQAGHLHSRAFLRFMSIHAGATPPKDSK